MAWFLAKYAMQPFTFFISYRRKDTAPIALLLKYELEKRLRFVRVFVDVEELQPGEAFPDRLQREIEGAHATIVLIGPKWMPGVDETVTTKHDGWVEHEIIHSRDAQMLISESDRHGRKTREIIPIFANTDRDFSQFQIPESISFLSVRNAEQIDYGSWPAAIGPLIDRIADRFELTERPDSGDYPEADPAKARTQRVADSELTQILAYDDYNGWHVDNLGNAEARYLVKIFRFKDFKDAAAFMADASSYCQTLNHHPDWRNVFSQVTVSLTTSDAHRQVTIYDLNLALYMNRLEKEINERT